MREQVLKTIRRYQMIADGARVGARGLRRRRSVALLEVLRELGAARGWTLEVLPSTTACAEPNRTAIAPSSRPWPRNTV